MSRKSQKKKKRSRSAEHAQPHAAKTAGSRKNRTVPFVWAGVIAAIVFGAYYLSGASANKARDVPSLGNRHIRVGTSSAVTYNTDPPTSGPHYPTIVSWGVHWKPIDKGFQVHNLEDGGVLVQYGCSDCPELVKNLESIVRRYPKYVALAPYPFMKHRIALTAWGKIDTLEAFDEERITAFINAYRGIDHHPRRRR
ncbi:MAG: DUF3105 domain-containing protein [Rhodospirillaceae bacterium]|nr:DUF3105 domain-containing protein [Rhodospirillaceae bacterium]